MKTPKQKHNKTQRWTGLGTSTGNSVSDTGYLTIRHGLENILTDRALFGNAEDELRRVSTHKSTKKTKPAVRALLPHEKGYVDVLADETGEDLDHVITPPNGHCSRCEGNHDALIEKLKAEQEHHAKVASISSSTELLTESSISLRSIRSTNPNVAERQVDNACWSWFVSELMNAGYVNPKSGLPLRIDNDNGIKESNPRVADCADDIDDGTASYPGTVLSAKLVALAQSVNLDDPSTHIRGLPIPPVFKTIIEKSDKLRRQDLKARKQLKVPTDFKKKPPKLHEQLVFDFDGTGSTLRVVTVTGFRPNEKGFIVDNGMKVSWSGKPKSSANSDALIRRDTEELAKRRRECSVSMLEAIDWSTLPGFVLDQITGAVAGAKMLQKQRKEQKQAEKDADGLVVGKHKKHKNKSSKHPKHQGK